MADEEPELADQRDIDQVYQPAEDSHLLAETATEHIDPEDIVLDVGTGSGYVGAFIKSKTAARVVGTDINPGACKQARERGLDVFCGDLVAGVAADSFDVICFNPPYLPDSGEGVWDDWMETAVTGGDDGRAIIEPFLEAVERVLRPGGAVFLLLSTLTGPDEVRELAREAGFSTDQLASESHPFEKLLVFRLVPES
jgi:release factor glutamine methyltransferase